MNVFIRLFLLTICFFLQGCWALQYYEYDSARQRKIPVRNLPVSLPIGVKKAKRHIVPSNSFKESMKAFRESKGTLPSSTWELINFSNYARNSVDEMYSSGFIRLDIFFFSPDSAKVWFSHKPVYRQKVGITDFGGSEIEGTFVFIYNDSSFKTLTRFH